MQKSWFGKVAVSGIIILFFVLASTITSISINGRDPGENDPPIADAGGPYFGFVNLPIIFDGSGSYDPDGGIANWSWDFGDGTNGYSEIITHSYSNIGTYIVTLTVMDDAGDIDIDTTNATINPAPPIANFTYLVEERYVTFDASSSYDPDGTIIGYEWDFGDGSAGSGEIEYHKYCGAETYFVTLIVTDNDALQGNITKSIEILIPNTPPIIPTIDGPQSGKPNVEYTYTFCSTSPDAEDYLLWIDWGDENNTEWLGPYTSGEEVTQSHIWSEKGTYIIKAKTKDDCDSESPWANFEVTIPRNKVINRTILNFLLNHKNLFPIIQILLRLLK